MLMRFSVQEVAIIINFNRHDQADGGGEADLMLNLMISVGRQSLRVHSHFSPFVFKHTHTHTSIDCTTEMIGIEIVCNRSDTTDDDSR